MPVADIDYRIILATNVLHDILINYQQEKKKKKGKKKPPTVSLTRKQKLGNTNK